MADDLVFPPDDISSLIGDFESSLNEDVLRSDINPSFPHSELLHIPQIIPSMMNSNDSRRTYQNSRSVESNYTPISQLMKQTEELTSTLASPLSSSINQQISSSNVVNTSSLNNRILSNNIQPTELSGNSMNFINSHSPKNTQYLVVGGQRIAAQHNMSPSQNHLPGSPLQIQGTSLDSLNVHNNKPVSPHAQQQQIQQQTHQMINMNSQSKQQPLVLKIPTPTQPQSQHQQTSQRLLQTGMRDPTALQGQKGPLKGSIIKTANQQLMFVTEVEGKKVGYVIQSPKPNAPVSSPSVSTPNVNVPVAVTSVTSPSVPVISSLSSDNILLKNNISNSIGMTSPQNIDDSSRLLGIQKNKDTSKPNDMTRMLRERLQGLRTNNVNLKNQLNLKQQSTLNINNNDKQQIIENQVKTVYPVTQNLNPVSKIISDFDSAMNGTKSNKPDLNRTDKSMASSSSMEFIDEEDGQEIEFSENDLTALDNNDDDSDEPLITSISVKQCNEIEDITDQQLNEDEDSDSVPLALLKTDTFEEPISIVCEKEDSVAKPTKRSKKSEQETNDSLPLSVVAASLKKGQEDVGKGKKRGRKKKKKKDENEPVKPILAYQVFFKEEQQRLKLENPMYKENFGELSKKIGHLWEIIDVDKKKAYQEDYSKAKAEYLIKLAEYKEQKAKELEEAGVNGIIDDDETGEHSPSKKTPTKKTTKKYAKKLTTKTIATTSSLSPPIEPMDEESNDSFTTASAAEVGGKSLKRKYNKTKKTTQPPVPITPSPSPPSPSPPSSDTEESSDEEEEDSKISRIRELAAKATKQLKKIEKQSVKGKAKEVGKKTRVVKMEVETVSEKVIMEHPSNETLFDSDMKSPPNNENIIPTPLIPSPQKAEPRVVKVKETTIINREKDVDNIVGEDDEKTANHLFQQISPKTIFKIPKRANGEAGQVPQGPRLCVRESCTNPIKATRERGAQYCSNDCLVLYCREVFDSWVLDRHEEDNPT